MPHPGMHGDPRDVVSASSTDSSHIVPSQVVTAQWCTLNPSHPSGSSDASNDGEDAASAGPAPRPSERLSHAAAMFRDHLYIFGGWIDGEEAEDDEDEDEGLWATEFFRDLWRIEVRAKTASVETASRSKDGLSQFTNTSERRTQVGAWEELEPHTKARWGHTMHAISCTDVGAIGTASVGSTTSGKFSQHDVLLSIGGFPMSNLELHAYDVDEDEWASVGILRPNPALQSPDGTAPMEPNVSHSAPVSPEMNVNGGTFNFSKYANTVGSQQSGNAGGQFSSSNSRDMSTPHHSGDTDEPAEVPWQPATRYCHTSCAHNDRVIVFGGLRDSETLHDSLLVIDTGAWAQPPPVERQRSNDENEQPSKWLCAWSPKAFGDYPVARFCHAASVVGDAMYVHGGTSVDDTESDEYEETEEEAEAKRTMLADLYCLNLNTFIWERVEISSSPERGFLSKPEPRFQVPSVNDIYGHLLLFGGVCNDMETNATDMYIFALKAQRWCVVQSHVGQYPQQVRGQSAVTLLDNATDGLRVLLFGGGDENGDYLNDLLELHISASDREKLQDHLGVDDRDPLQEQMPCVAVATPPPARKAPSHPSPHYESDNTSRTSRSTDASSIRPNRQYGVMRRSDTGYASSSSVADTSPESYRQTPPQGFSDRPPSGMSSAYRDGDGSSYNATPGPTLGSSSAAVAPNGASTTNALSAVLSMLQDIHIDMSHRFSDLEGRIAETNSRVDRLRDSMLHGIRTAPLNASQQVANEVLLSEVRLLREQVANQQMSYHHDQNGRPPPHPHRR